MAIGNEAYTATVGEYRLWDSVAGQHRGGSATDILQQIKDSEESTGETVEDHYAVEGVLPDECMLGNEPVTVETGFTDGFSAATSLIDIEGPENVEACPHRHRVVLGYEFEGALG